MSATFYNWFIIRVCLDLRKQKQHHKPFVQRRISRSADFIDWTRILSKKIIEQ